MNDKAVHRIAPSLGGLKPREFLACRLRDQTIFDVRTKSFSTEKRVLPDLVLFFLLCYQRSMRSVMSIIYIFDVQYICRLAPEVGWILNAYTPVRFQS